VDGEILGQPLKWWGGKHYLAKRIIALMPRHLHYVEPFAGGLAVLLEKNPFETSHYWGEKGYEQGISEVANDIHQGLTNFWRVLQSDGLSESDLRPRAYWLAARGVRDRQQGGGGQDKTKND